MPKAHQHNAPCIAIALRLLIALAFMTTAPEGLQAQNLKKELAYVKNQTADVTVIDLDTGAHIATIPIAGSGTAALVLTPDQTRAYVADRSGTSVSVIDTTTNTNIATVTVGPHPYGVAVTPDGQRVYAANFNANTVSVIDTNLQSSTYHEEIDLIQVGQNPHTIAITPCGLRAYVSNRTSNEVAVIDLDPTSPTYHTTTEFISVPIIPRGIDLSPDGKKAYVSRLIPGGVSIIDTDPNSPTFNTITETITGLGDNPLSVAVTPDGSFVYVGDRHDNHVSVIDTSNNSVLTRISVDDGGGGNRIPDFIAFDSAGQRAFVAKEVGLSAIIDTATHTVLDFIAPGNGAAGVAIKQTYNVGGCFSGITPRRVVCKNTTTGQKVVIRTLHESWDCEAAGLVVNTGDRIVQRVIGFAE